MDTELQTVIDGLTKEELTQLRKMLGIGIKRDAKTAKDPSPTLKTPIRFFNDRYREERFYVHNRLKKFSNGVFTAQTEDEAKAARALGAYVFEGQDTEEPMLCRVCQRSFFNTKAMLWHLQFQHAVA